jgi:hypothetical protein
MSLNHLVSCFIFILLGLAIPALAETKILSQHLKKHAVPDKIMAAGKTALPETLTQAVTAAPNRSHREKKQTFKETSPPRAEAAPAEAPAPVLRGDMLRNRPTVLTTAHHLQRGEVLSALRYRQSFPSGTAADVGLTGQPTFGINWGVTDNLEITLDAQTADNSGPGDQGEFRAQRTTVDGSGNFFQELTLQAKQRIWENREGTQALSGVFAISRGVRSYRFYTSRGRALSGGENQEELVTSLELPYTIIVGNRWQFTFSPKVAFLPKDNALYFRRPPVDDPGSFGTTLGFAGGVSYSVNPKLLLWGDAFVPVAGNNTINRDTGLPARTIAFNAGLRYLVNPRLAADLFLSNALGNTGAMSIVADREFISLGFGLAFIPAFTRANRQYPQSFYPRQQPPPFTPAGFAFFDGGTLPNQQVLATLQAGSQGLLAAIQYGLLDDFEVGLFLDAISGITDESELGISGKIRFLHQADGDPFTLSALVTVSRSNNVLLNLLSENPDELKNRNLEKRGFALKNEICSEDGGITGNDGECLILTLSVPVHYQYPSGKAIWLTPTLGYAQRNGLEIAGFNVGGSYPLSPNLNLIAEAGLNLSGKGNALIGSDRETAIPWSLGLRWNAEPAIANPGLQVELYLTNRVGATPFQTLRVRADNDIALGVGLLFPFQF